MSYTLVPRFTLYGFLFLMLGICFGNAKNIVFYKSGKNIFL